ncbi:transposase [Spirosoma sp. SC4-14]|uniref:transposase n=1 Tax=Spirosoma sp. SC4-14 TaxID=3128900 RepID=UPI0030D10A10
MRYRSGTSVRGKTKVSHQARKRLKALVHMGTMSAIQMKGDLQDYYQRKLGEGKHKMLVLNAVRNKLIHRVCAVVRRGEKYSDRRCGQKLYVSTCLSHRNRSDAFDNLRKWDCCLKSTCSHCQIRQNPFFNHSFVDDPHYYVYLKFALQNSHGFGDFSESLNRFIL